MHMNNVEAAYWMDRITQSTALALAAPDSCARPSHEAMTALYKHRLAALTQPNPTTRPSPTIIA